MKIKEIFAYILGLIVIIYGAFGGRNLSSMNDVLEGVVIFVFFLSVYVVFIYMNKRGIGDWNRYNK